MRAVITLLAAAAGVNAFTSSLDTLSPATIDVLKAWINYSVQPNEARSRQLGYILDIGVGACDTAFTELADESGSITVESLLEHKDEIQQIIFAVAQTRSSCHNQDYTCAVNDMSRLQRGLNTMLVSLTVEDCPITCSQGLGCN